MFFWGIALPLYKTDQGLKWVIWKVIEMNKKELEDEDHVSDVSELLDVDVHWETAKLKGRSSESTPCYDPNSVLIEVQEQKVSKFQSVEVLTMSQVSDEMLTVPIKEQSSSEHCSSKIPVIQLSKVAEEEKRLPLEEGQSLNSEYCSQQKEEVQEVRNNVRVF